MRGVGHRKKVTTRKEHQCALCQERISIGEVAIYHTYMSDRWFGYWHRVHYHLECNRKQLEDKRS